VAYSSAVAVGNADLKPVRRDVKRNHERIVSSARVLFARSGLEVSVETISRDAGVGIGTLYRHFATKDALIDAVLEDAFQEYLALARDAAELPDAWNGLCRFFERAFELHAANRGLKDAVATRAHGLRGTAAMRRRLRPLLLQLVEGAQEQGTLRQDFTPEDVSLILWAGHGVIDCSDGVAPEIWKRYLGFTFDGMRSKAATPLPCPSLTANETNRAGR
jgi:AcrR family transcriptional regulator